MRSVKTPQAKSLAVELLAWASSRSDDEVRLNRIVPYLSVLIVDEHESAVVRARAITCVTWVLAQVRRFPVSEQQVFLHYVLPTLSSALKDAPHNEIVCVAYAANLGSLAETAQRFLDIGHSLKRRELQRAEAISKHLKSASQNQGKACAEEAAEADTQVERSKYEELGYDSEVTALHDALVAVARELLCHRSAAVKRMLLSDILRLCLLLGRERTCNSLLPLIITVLNHRGDWQVAACLLWPPNSLRLPPFSSFPYFPSPSSPLSPQSLSSSAHLYTSASFSARWACRVCNLLSPSQATPNTC